MNRFAAILIALSVAVAGGAARAAPVSAPHATAELIAETRGVAPGSTLYVAVVLTASKGWHTYWRNPGDAGEATSLKWTLPSGWRVGEIVWPAPKRLPVGPIMNYGYEGPAVLAIPVQIPASARGGQMADLRARVDYLVCADVCVPGSASLALSLPVVDGAPAMDTDAGPVIQNALAEAPKPAGLTATFQAAPGKLTLAVTGAALAGASPADVYFYPYSDSLIDHAKPQIVERGPQGLTLTLTPGSAFTSPAAPPAEASGVLAVDGKSYEITAKPSPAPAGAAGLGPLARAPGGGLGLPGAVVFAFAGGVILNLMPCVFPILSMKAAALARQVSAGNSRTQGVAFLGGVLLTFGVLAGLLIAARSAGAAIGWGFQLQSPLVVALLSLVMLAAALNLSGVYELGGSAQGFGAGLMASHGETLGTVLTGMLAVVVAAPCTAPFMGPALGFALTQPPAAAMAVYLGLGLGFAAPFTLLAFTPALMRRLPRPGAWMEVLRTALAFPMYAAAAWLLWVLSRQTGSEGLARLLIAAVILSLGAWLFGVAQRRRARGSSGMIVSLLAAASLAISVGAVAAGRYAPAPQAAAGSAPEVLASIPFSPDRLATLRAAGRPVLVNFTAAWCVTCQVNERVAFSSAPVAAALRRAGATYLVADWTNRDTAIAKALADQGRIGVPLYLLYAPGATNPKVLPQILTPAILAQALDEASLPPSPGAAKRAS